MVITWHGLNALKIVEKEITIAINPHSGKEIKMPKFAADILLLGTHEAISSIIREKPFVIEKPGEYEVKNIFVYGLPAQGEKGKSIIFDLDVSGVRLGYLGGLAQEELTPVQQELIEGVDILFVPVGDNGTLTAKQAVKIINQVEPRVIIPIDYKTKEIKTNRDNLEKFLKEYGVNNIEEVDKLKIAKKDLPQEETKVIVINPS